MKMTFSRISLILFILFLTSCATQMDQKVLIEDSQLDSFNLDISNFINNQQKLKSEVLKINAKSPSIQRILNNSDEFWLKGNLKKTNSELERALRLSKSESAVYLRLSHLRLEQGLFIESKSFSSRGLMNNKASSWEFILLKIYQKLE